MRPPGNRDQRGVLEPAVLPMAMRRDDAREGPLRSERTIQIAPEVEAGQRFQQHLFDRVTVALELAEDLGVQRPSSRASAAIPRWPGSACAGMRPDRATLRGWRRQASCNASARSRTVFRASCATQGAAGKQQRRQGGRWQGCFSWTCQRAPQKISFQPELDNSLAVLHHLRDLPELRGRDVAVRQPEIHAVEQVECLGPELQRRLPCATLVLSTIRSPC